jgi:cell wall-associated NlpC family hydrolase
MVKDKAPFSAFSAAALSIRDSLVELVRAQKGSRYRRGEETPTKGFDCSGLVQYVLGVLRLDLPRTAAQQGALGEPIPKERSFLRPGDLLTFGRGTRVTHIGVYVGEGRFVHASVKAGRVIESSLDRVGSPLVRNWTGARRILAVTEDPCTASGACARP